MKIDKSKENTLNICIDIYTHTLKHTYTYKQRYTYSHKHITRCSSQIVLFDIMFEIV